MEKISFELEEKQVERFHLLAERHYQRYHPSLVGSGHLGGFTFIFEHDAICLGVEVKCRRPHNDGCDGGVFDLTLGDDGEFLYTEDGKPTWEE